MKAFKNEWVLYVPQGGTLPIDQQVKLLQLTPVYGMIFFVNPPPDTTVTDVTAEIEEKLKS